MLKGGIQIETPFTPPTTSVVQLELSVSKIVRLVLAPELLHVEVVGVVVLEEFEEAHPPPPQPPHHHPPPHETELAALVVTLKLNVLEPTVR